MDAAQILLTHGADEMLDYLCRIVRIRDAAINCPPTFGMYSFDAELNGATVIDVPRDDDFGVDVDAVEAAADGGRAKLLFLTSPNNPLRQLAAGRARCRSSWVLPLLVVLDEAYVEFADHSSRAVWVDGA